MCSTKFSLFQKGELKLSKRPIFLLKFNNLHANRPQRGREPTTGHRLLCGHCTETFVLDILREAGSGRCPHCRRQSSTGPLYRQRKMLIYLVLCIIFGISSFVASVLFYHLFHFREVLGIADVFLFLSLCICIYKLIFFVRFKVSNIIESNIPGTDPNQGVHDHSSHGVSFSSNLIRLSSFRSFREFCKPNKSIMEGGGKRSRRK